MSTHPPSGGPQARISTRYRWGADSLITRIDIRTQKNGAIAYIYADSPSGESAKLQAVRAAIRAQGWSMLADHRNGGFSLRVSGMENSTALLDVLTRAGFLNGAPQIERHDLKGATPDNFGQFLKRHSLRASGLVYMLGNAMYYMSGVAAKSRDDKNMALSFAAGDALLGIFGGHDDARQFTSLLGKLKAHMAGEGMLIPEHSALEVETSTAGQGLAKRTANFLHTHINTLKISAEVLGGYFALRSGLKKDAATGKNNPLKIAGGVVVMLGWTAALLIKEKKPDEEKLETAGVLARTAAHIQEKPLRLAGWAGLTFNALNFGSTWHKRTTPTGKWNMGAVGAMVSANGLYSISNKTTGGDIKTQEIISDVYNIAAQILNAQPENRREAAIASTAQFLGERPEIKDTHREIITRLKAEMTSQRQNPWYESAAPSRIASPAGPEAGAPLPRVSTQGLEHQARAAASATPASYALR